MSISNELLFLGVAILERGDYIGGNFPGDIYTGGQLYRVATFRGAIIPGGNFLGGNLPGGGVIFRTREEKTTKFWRNNL